MPTSGSRSARALWYWRNERRISTVEFCERYWPSPDADDDPVWPAWSDDVGASQSKRCDTCCHLTDDGRCGWRSVPLAAGWPVERLNAYGSC